MISESEMILVGIGAFLVGAACSTVMLGISINDNWNAKCKLANIKLVPHYIDVDGVRSNWTEIVYLNENK